MRRENILKLLVPGILTLFIFTSCQGSPEPDEWRDSPEWGDTEAVVRSWSDDMKDADKERVMIEAGDVSIGATLYRPQNALGDLPGIVIVHGSGRTDRKIARFYTFRAFQMGFAVLAFDKRGVGESTGEYIPFDVETSEATFSDLASDVAYAVRWLAEQPGIDANRIGLFGGSQAGWIMPLAASKEPLVKFIIAGEGPSVTAGEEQIHGAVGGDGSIEWTAENIQRADVALRNYTGDQGFHPAPILETLDVPTLWIFGLRDDVIPVNASLERPEELIKDGQTNNDIHIFPLGDHNFMNIETGERYDLRAISENWLEDIGILE